ncbi:hypothetical protein EXIGLDRAFT_675503 [Exidia glandulosa HHB12029]|uniref:1,3-beta-glucanosyltransferase n=1 Tax=Exidia glandulosa HHB12029 TaxID=1314781 RepID=A0A165HKN6_EXIGL|nr:hypothetical protein EXIGLDRAFT_675503 [Exidia glandulosa HHB12029]
MRFSLPLLSASALLAASGVSALPKVSRVGRYLYDESGTRFFVKGIAYQEPGTGAFTVTNGFPEPDDFIDPLVDSTACNRDLPYLKQLGVNAVRVYSVDPTLNHDACMQAFSGAGIYTIIDLSQPKNGSLDRSAPKWTTNLLNLYLTTIDAFSKYDNVLAFTVGNEVVTAPAETVAAPFIKAAARDVKAYLKSKSISALVTYASTDGSQWRNNLAQYLSCGDESTTIDLYGLNNYEWKGDASIQSYGGTNTAFSTYNIPAYFSEYGSNANFPTPRPFTEVAALFGPEMSQTWSGGLAFSYFQGTEQGFGVVDLSEDGSTVTPNQDFTNLQTQYGAVTFQTTPAMADAGATQYPACVEPDGVNFLGSNTLPPTPNQDACNCVVEKASPCVYQARTENFSAVVGPLFSFACSTLGSQGSDACSDLAANGTTGVYGPMSACDPQSQLSFVFGAFYEASGQNVASCNFDGNATLNANAPTSSAGVEAATSSCLSNALSVSTPTGPSSPVETTHSGGSNGTTTGGGSGDGTGAATRVGLAVGTMFLAFLAGVAML